ncbi:MAG TPA: DUF6600 domain-containing protein [Candidatus Limnocylindria bacterium]|nr:DUF6600 domain-containing protein [Candidatus Limnocylindria bacterium]
MKRRRLLLIACALLALAQLSCASGGGPTPPSQPTARGALYPELRVFYDALTDYGDWVLIEPHGYVFRPAVDFISWRPYQEGFWVPTDLYGWVWVSAEPFGWATYHYGQWFYDRFQGWVWQPGLDWGPAWVAWEASDQYVGWSPLLAASANGSGGSIPGGPFVYAPIQQLGSTQLKSSIVTESALGDASARLSRVDHKVVRDGVEMQLGPPIGRIERVLGAPLPRSRVDDLIPASPTLAGGGRRTPSRGGAATPVDPKLIETTRQAGEEASRRARAVFGREGPAPSRVPVVRVGGLRGAVSGKPAPADSSR